MNTTMQPTQSNERYEVLDVLRGFALLGVMIANMAYHSGHWFLSPEKQAALSFYHFGELVTWIVHFVTEGKFYSIFSLLFGIGFGLQIQKAMQKNQPFAGRFSRRLLILLLFGILHAIFLYVGDILTVYALLGFALILFRNSGNKTLLCMAFVLPVVPVIQYGIMWYQQQGAPPVDQSDSAAMFAQIVNTYQTGTFGEILFTNFGGLVFGRYPDLIFTGRFFKVFAMFLLGFYITRNSWFAEIPKRREQLKRIMLWSALVGIPCNLVMAHMMSTGAYYTMAPSGIIEPIVYAFGVPALGICYACGIALAYQKDKFKAPLQILAPLGRMALTNYLMQSVIGCLIFQSYGLGLFGHISPVFFTLIGISILILQLIFSNWWLSKYQYGPAEWLWRSMTYRKIQPIKIKESLAHGI
ncbi:MAG: DUF418 domain-containing protein [Bacteroidota bacterium]